MKNIVLLIAALSAFFISSLSAQEKAEEYMNKLVVSGSAEIKVPANEASFSFSVVGYGETLRQAVGNANKKISDISKKLFKIGLKDRNLNTARFFSGENKGSKAFLSSSKDFKTSMSVIVNLDSLDLLEETILTLSECEIEDLSNIDFNIKDYTQIKQKARAQALDNAINKARQMADQAGIKLKKIVYISENPPMIFNSKNISPYNSVLSLQAGVASNYIPSELGRFYEKAISIAENIYVIYELE